MAEKLQLGKEIIELERMRLELEKEKREFLREESLLELSKGSQEFSREELLLELLKENWAHGRHIESERLDFTSIYVAIVGGTLAFIGDKFNLQNMYYIFAFLLVFSILGFQLSKKWGAVFDNHMGKVKNITMDLSSASFDGSRYVALQNYESKVPFLKNCKRTKNLFNGFYILMMLVWLALLIISISKNITYYIGR